MLEERCGVCGAQLYEIENMSHRPGREIVCRICNTRHTRRAGKYVVAEGESSTQQYGEVTEFAKEKESQPLLTETVSSAETVSEVKPTKRKSSKRTRRR